MASCCDVMVQLAELLVLVFLTDLLVGAKGNYQTYTAQISLLAAFPSSFLAFFTSVVVRMLLV